MNQKTIVLFVILFVVIVLGMFTFAYLQNKEIAELVVPTPVAEDPVGNQYGITRIDGKHFFIDGVHTIVGEVPMPTPCDLLKVESVVAESFPEQVTFDFSVINTSEMCAQVVTLQRFKVDASASDQANLAARFMGQSVDLNLVEAAEGETPDEFELFIKG